MEKQHKQDVAPIEKENERDEKYKSDNPQIDSERTRNNYRFTPYFGKTYTEFINGRIKELGLSPRKDAVVMNSFVLGSDKIFFDGLSKAQQYNFFSACYKFFAERYGEENIIAAVVHNDETTPHMHLNLMPVTKDGRLCSKQLFDKPQLQQLQTNFYETVGKRWGLQRGKEGSQKKHLSIAEFKAKKIIEQAEAIREENQVYADAITEAKSGNIPRKREKLQEQVIALTADNNDLSKRLTKSMDEALLYAKKSEALQKKKENNSHYTNVGKELAGVESAIEGFLSAIAAGVVTKSTKKRMLLLEVQKEELENKIALEKQRTVQPLKYETVRAFLYYFSKKKYKSDEEKNEFFNSFIYRVVLFDDYIYIFYNTSPEYPTKVKLEKNELQALYTLRDNTAVTTDCGKDKKPEMHPVEKDLGNKKSTLFEPIKFKLGAYGGEAGI